MCNAAFNFLGRHFANAGVRFFKPLADGLDRIHGEAGILLNEIVPKLRRPGQNNAFGNGHCSAGIVAALQSLSEAEQIAGMNHANNDLLSVRCYLIDLEATVKQQKEQDGIVALLKNGFASNDTPR
ncbi:hypothetical protein D9M69_638780 [compost metagenome]